MNLQPLGDRIVVKPALPEEKTAGGLLLSRDSQEKPQQGEVVAVGAGRRNKMGERIALDVAVGDQVLYGKFGGNEVKIGEETYLILREEDIYAIVK